MRQRQGEVRERESERKRGRKERGPLGVALNDLQRANTFAIKKRYYETLTNTTAPSRCVLDIAPYD